MSSKAILSSEDADKELQNIFKSKKNALTKDSDSVWVHFTPTKVADGEILRCKLHN